MGLSSFCLFFDNSFLKNRCRTFFNFFLAMLFKLAAVPLLFIAFPIKVFHRKRGLGVIWLSSRVATIFMKIARSPRPCFYLASADALLRYAFCRAVHSPVKLLKPLFRLVCFFRFAFRVAADRPSGKKFGGVRIRGKGNFFEKRYSAISQSARRGYFVKSRCAKSLSASFR